MTETDQSSKTILVHFGTYDQSHPMLALASLASLGLVADQREEIEWWFEAALTHQSGVYDIIEQRSIAFDLRNALLKVLELAHFLERMDNNQKKELLLKSL